MARFRQPLAWKNLTYDLRRLTLAVAGIAFAVVLMFQQRGFQHALFDSTIKLVDAFQGELVLVAPSRYSLSVESRFDQSWLDVVGSQPGISRVVPIYLENMAARLRRDQNKARPIRVVGLRLTDPVFHPDYQPTAEAWERMADPNSALMDRYSRTDYGFELSNPAEFPQTGTLNQQPLHVVGSFESGRDFANSGNLLMSDANFSRYFMHRGSRPLAQVDLALVHLTDPTQVRDIQAKLSRLLEPAVQVHTRTGFMQREIELWDRSTPIGVIFWVGTVMGFVVGVIICYQVLANAIADHLGEFATLKAMGYPDRYFIQLTLLQSVYLAALGFFPGWLVSLGLFQFNHWVTALPLEMTVGRVGLVFAATLVMCMLSALLALRKLFAADPASLF